MKSKFQLYNRDDKDLSKRQSKNAKRRKVQGTNSKWKRTRRHIKHKLIAR